MPNTIKVGDKVTVTPIDLANALCCQDITPNKEYTVDYSGKDYPDYEEDRLKGCTEQDALDTVCITDDAGDIIQLHYTSVTLVTQH